MPTANYSLFTTAEQLGVTVREMLTGQKAPLTAMEEYLWRRFRLATARLKQQQRSQFTKVG